MREVADRQTPANVPLETCSRERLVLANVRKLIPPLLPTTVDAIALGTRADSATVAKNIQELRGRRGAYEYSMSETRDNILQQRS